MPLSEEKIDGVSIDLIPAWELGLRHAVQAGQATGYEICALREIERLRAEVAGLEQAAEEADRRGEERDREHQRALDHAGARASRWQRRCESAEARVSELEAQAATGPGSERWRRE